MTDRENMHKQSYKCIDKKNASLDNGAKITAKSNNSKKGGEAMSAVTFKVTVPVSVKKKGNLWISSCPCLDVISQGLTEEEAKKNIEDALQLFLISCYERSTLDEALKQCGFKMASVQKPQKKTAKDTVTIPLYMLTSARCTTECRP